MECRILVKERSLISASLPEPRLDGEGAPREARVWGRATGVARLMHVEFGRLVHIQAEVSSKQSGYRLLVLIRDSWRGGADAVFQLLNRVRLFAIPRTVAHQASWSFTISRSLLKLTSIEGGTDTQAFKAKKLDCVSQSEDKQKRDRSELRVNWPIAGEGGGGVHQVRLEPAKESFSWKVKDARRPVKSDEKDAPGKDLQHPGLAVERAQLHSLHSSHTLSSLNLIPLRRMWIWQWPCTFCYCSFCSPCDRSINRELTCWNKE